MSQQKNLLTEVNERVNRVDLEEVDLDELEPQQSGEVVLGETDEELLRLHLAEVRSQHEIAEALSEISEVNLHDSVAEVAAQALSVPPEKQEDVRKVIQELVPLNEALDYLFSMSVARRYQLDPSFKYFIRKGGVIVVSVPQSRD